MSPFVRRRVDANQDETVKALRALGCSVQQIHVVGKGCPDLLVGYRGMNFLFELKVEKGKLNEAETEWHASWRGQATVVRTWGEAWEFVRVATTVKAA